MDEVGIKVERRQQEEAAELGKPMARQSDDCKSETVMRVRQTMLRINIETLTVGEKNGD